MILKLVQNYDDRKRLNFALTALFVQYIDSSIVICHCYFKYALMTFYLKPYVPIWNSGNRQLSTFQIFGSLSQIFHKINWNDYTHNFNYGASTTDSDNNNKFQHRPFQDILNASLKLMMFWWLKSLNTFWPTSGSLPTHFRLTSGSLGPHRLS